MKLLLSPWRVSRISMHLLELILIKGMLLDSGGVCVFPAFSGFKVRNMCWLQAVVDVNGLSGAGSNQ